MFKFLLDVAVRIDWGEVLPLVYRGLIGAIDLFRDRLGSRVGPVLGNSSAP